jgi:hypothetical protein
VAVLDGEREDLRHRVGVELEEARAQVLEAIRRGLQDRELLLVVLERALPRVDRAQTGEDVHARRQALLDDGAGDAGGGVARRQRTQDHEDVGRHDEADYVRKTV